MIDINSLKKYEPIYVIGHNNPDVDTMLSSYLLSNILKYFGIKSYYCFLREGYTPSSYNGRLVNDYLDFNPIIIDNNDVSNYHFALVDHNDPMQSIKTAENVVFGMDHHRDSGKASNILFGKTCSNGLFIYEYFKDIYNFSEKEKELIYLTTMCDTLFFKSDRYTSYNRDLINELGIDLDSEKLLKKYFAPTDLSMGIKKYLEKSDRDFAYHGVLFSSSVIHSFDDNNKILEYKEEISKRNDNHLGMWRDLTNNKTYAFLKVNGQFTEFQYDLIASRASTVMLDVIEFLKQQKNEKEK